MSPTQISSQSLIWNAPWTNSQEYKWAPSWHHTHYNLNLLIVNYLVPYRRNLKGNAKAVNPPYGSPSTLSHTIQKSKSYKHRCWTHVLKIPKSKDPKMIYSLWVSSLKEFQRKKRAGAEALRNLITHYGSKRPKILVKPIRPATPLYSKLI